MKKQDIEFWTSQVIERAQTNQQTEDAFVEFKREWIPPAQVARKIAGHANAARGEPILWIIGVDEKTGNVLGADQNDLADWWQGVKSQFESIYPSMVDLIVHVQDKTVVALYMETDRAPYVIKNPSGGTINYEVPWREGTSTRTARREDLIKILVPLSRLPEVRFLPNSTLDARLVGTDTVNWSLNLELYLTSLTDDPIYIPNIDNKASFALLPTLMLPDIEFDNLIFVVPNPNNYATNIIPGSPIQAVGDQLIIKGAGTIKLSGQATTKFPNGLKLEGFKRLDFDILLNLEFRPARSAIPSKLSVNFAPSLPDATGGFRKWLPKPPK